MMAVLMVLVIMVTRGCGGRGRLGQSVGRFLHRAEASSSVRTAFMIGIVVIKININKVIIMIIFNIIYQDQPAPWVHQRQW